MKNKSSGVFIFTFMLFIAALTMGGCSTTKLISYHPDDNILIDGSDKEWKQKPQYYDKEKRFSVKFAHDPEFIYLCLKSGDRGLNRKLMMTGLTLWLDPDGGQEKAVGIRLPGRKPPRKPPDDMASAKEKKPEENRMPEYRLPKRLEVIYSESGIPVSMRIAEAAASGIEVAATHRAGLFTYEYKVKIRGQRSLDLNPSINPEQLSYLGIGIISGEMDKGEKEFRRRRNYGGMGRSSSMMGGYGGRGGMGGRPGGGPGRRMKEMGEPFELWLKIEMKAD